MASLSLGDYVAIGADAGQITKVQGSRLGVKLFAGRNVWRESSEVKLLFGSGAPRKVAAIGDWVRTATIEQGSMTAPHTESAIGQVLAIDGRRLKVSLADGNIVWRNTDACVLPSEDAPGTNVMHGAGTATATGAIAATSVFAGPAPVVATGRLPASATAAAPSAGRLPASATAAAPSAAPVRKWSFSRRCSREASPRRSQLAAAPSIAPAASCLPKQGAAGLVPATAAAPSAAPVRKWSFSRRPLLGGANAPSACTSAQASHGTAANAPSRPVEGNAPTALPAASRLPPPAASPQPPPAAIISASPHEARKDGYARLREGSELSAAADELGERGASGSAGAVGFVSYDDWPADAPLFVSHDQDRGECRCCPEPLASCCSLCMDCLEAVCVALGHCGAAVAWACGMLTCAGYSIRNGAVDSVRAIWVFILGPTFPETAVGSFVDGTLAYTLSKIWYDLISTYILGLHPEPFCELDDSCTPEASASLKFRFALALLPLLALLKLSSAQSFWTHVPGIETLPAMTGMLAGWALGDACLQLLVELREGSLHSLCAAPPFEGSPSDCTWLDLGYASLLTLLSSLAITQLQPFTKEIECGDGPWIDYAEDWLEALWQLVSKANATSVMVVWTSAFSSMVLTGLRPGYQPVAVTHLHVFWAMSFTFVGSLVTVRLQRWEYELQGQIQIIRTSLVETPSKSPPPGTREWADMTDAERAEQGARDVASLDNLSSGSGANGGGMRIQRGGRAKGGHLHRIRMMIEFSNLVQGTLGWVAGCAWTDVAVDLFPSLSLPPTSHSILLANVGVALGLTALSTCWLVFGAASSVSLSEEDMTNREAVEAYFLTGAMSFFVGWAWVLVIRDSFHPFGQAVGALVDDAFGSLELEDGSYVHTAWAARGGYIGQLVSVLIFAPVLVRA